MKNIIRIPVEEHFAGDYRLEYDGKYVTLFGKDKKYDMAGLMGAPEHTYEEMVLIPVVEEVRGAQPFILSVGEKEIVVNLGLIKREDLVPGTAIEVCIVDEGGDGDVFEVIQDAIWFIEGDWIYFENDNTAAGSVNEINKIIKKHEQDND